MVHDAGPGWSATRPRGLEVLIDHPNTNTPDGWHAEGDGLVWVLDEPVDPDEPLDGPMCPAPLLVTIGQPDDDAQLYIDLEADGIVSLAGDVEVARDPARSMVTELALAPLADTPRMIVIGDLVEPDAAHLDHLTLVETWADVADDITTVGRFASVEEAQVAPDEVWAAR
jgi:hypothetical protein